MRRSTAHPAYPATRRPRMPPPLFRSPAMAARRSHPPRGWMRALGRRWPSGSTVLRLSRGGPSGA
eukprot:4050291-Prymnesium_polylepis.1